MGSLNFDIDTLKQTTTWLPSQEQLQGMMDDDCAICMHSRFSAFVNWWLDGHQLDEKGSSMTKLWLEFVMKVKYDKVWNGVVWL